MKSGRTLLGAGESLLDRVLCVAGAIVFSQVPEFMQQYLQRLGGHLDEARRQVQQFEHAAAQSGLTVGKLIGQTAANGDPAVARLGGVMKEAVMRVDTLAAAQSAVEHASLWSRPFVFVQHLDPAIARATWAVFKPAVPTTIEGLVYALLGMLILMAVYSLIKYPFTRTRQRSQPVPADPEIIMPPASKPAKPKPSSAPPQDVTAWAQPPRPGPGPGTAPPSLRK
jgi:hypothetical protein